MANNFWSQPWYKNYIQRIKERRQASKDRVTRAKAVNQTSRATASKRVTRISPSNTYQSKVLDISGRHSYEEAAASRSRYATGERLGAMAERYKAEQAKIAAERSQSAAAARLQEQAEAEAPSYRLRQMTAPPPVKDTVLPGTAPRVAAPAKAQPKEQFTVAPGVKEGDPVYVDYDPVSRTNIITSRDTGIKLYNYNGTLLAAYINEDGEWALEPELQALGLSLDLMTEAQYSPDIVETLGHPKPVTEQIRPITVDGLIKTNSPLYYDPILNQITHRKTQTPLFWTQDHGEITNERRSLDANGNIVANEPLVYDMDSSKFLQAMVAREQMQYGFYDVQTKYGNPKSPDEIVTGHGKVTTDDIANMTAVRLEGKLQEGTTVYLGTEGQLEPLYTQPGTPTTHLPYQWREFEMTLRNSKLLRVLLGGGIFPEMTERRVNRIVDSLGSVYMAFDEAGKLPKQSNLISQESAMTRPRNFGQPAIALLYDAGLTTIQVGRRVLSWTAKLAAPLVSVFDREAGKSVEGLSTALKEQADGARWVLDDVLAIALYTELEKPTWNYSVTQAAQPQEITTFQGREIGDAGVATAGEKLRNRVNRLNSYITEGSRLMDSSVRKYHTGLIQEAIEDRTEGLFKYYTQGLDWAAIHNYIQSGLSEEFLPVQFGTDELLRDEIPITGTELKALWQFVAYNDNEGLRLAGEIPVIYDIEGSNYFFLRRVAEIELQKGRRLTLGEMYDQSMIYMNELLQNPKSPDQIRTELTRISQRRHDRAHSLAEVGASYISMAETVDDPQAKAFYTQQGQAFMSEATLLLIGTYDIDRRGAAQDPFSAYSWNMHPDKIQGFYREVAQAELQLGRPLTRQEIVDVSYRSVNIGYEISGEILLDLMNVLDFLQVGKLAGAGAKGLIKGAGKLTASGLRKARWGADLVDAVISGSDELYNAIIASHIRGRAMVSTAHKQAQVISDLTNDLLKASPNNRDGFIQLYAQFGDDFALLKNATNAQEMADAVAVLSKKYPTISTFTIDQMQMMKLWDVVDPTELGKIAEKAWDDQMDFMIDRAMKLGKKPSAETRKILEQAAEADRATIVVNQFNADATKNMFSLAGKSRLSNKMGDYFRGRFIEAHAAWQGSVFLEDTVLAKLGRTWVKNPSPDLVKWRSVLTNLNTVYRKFMNAWVWATLARRPAWMIYNFLDNTFRFMVSGGGNLVDLVRTLDKDVSQEVLEKIGIKGEIATDMADSMFRTIIEPLEGGAKEIRQLPGLTDLRDNPLGFFQHYKLNYAALTSGKGPTAHAYAVWRAFPLSVKSLANAIEYGSRVRLYYKLYTRNMAKANASVLARLIHGFEGSPSLKKRLLDGGMTETQADKWVNYILDAWKTTGNNSQRFIESMTRLAAPDRYTSERLFVPESILNSEWFDEATFYPLMSTVMEEMKKFVGEQVQKGAKRLEPAQADQFFDRIIAVFDAEIQRRLNAVWNEQYNIIRGIDLDEGMRSLKARRYNPDIGPKPVSEVGEEAIQEVPVGTKKLTEKQRKKITKAIKEEKILVKDESDESLINAVDTLRERSEKTTARRKPLTTEEVKIVESRVDTVMPGDIPTNAAELTKLDETIRVGIPRLTYNDAGTREAKSIKDFLETAHAPYEKRNVAYIQLTKEQVQLIDDHAIHFTKQVENLASRIRTFWIHVYPGPKRLDSAGNVIFNGSTAKAWDGYFSRGTLFFDNIASLFDDLKGELDAGRWTLTSGQTVRDILDLAGIKPMFDTTGQLAGLRMYSPSLGEWETSTRGSTLQWFRDITGIKTQADYMTDVQLFIDPAIAITEKQVMEIESKILPDVFKSYDEMLQTNKRLSLAVKENRFADANRILAGEFRYPMFFEKNGQLIPSDRTLLNKVWGELGKKSRDYIKTLDDVDPNLVHKILDHWAQTNQGIRMTDMVKNLQEDFIDVMRKQYDYTEAAAREYFKFWDRIMGNLAELNAKLTGKSYTKEDAWMEVFYGFYSVNRNGHATRVIGLDGRPRFYSALSDLVNRHMTDGMTGSQVLEIARKHKLNEDELAWNGLLDWLQKNKDEVITREAFSNEVAARERIVSAKVVQGGTWKINIRNLQEDTLADITATFKMTDQNEFVMEITKTDGALDLYSMQRLKRWAKDNEADALVFAGNPPFSLKNVPNPNPVVRPMEYRYLASTDFITDLTQKHAAAIRAYSGSNLTSSLHEMFHAVEDHLPESIKKTLDDYADDTLSAMSKSRKKVDIEAFKRYKDLDPRAQRSEVLARAFEKYFITSEAPSEEIGKIFQALRSYFINLYKTMKGYFDGIYLTPEVRKAFDQLVLGDWKAGQAAKLPKPSGPPPAPRTPPKTVTKVEDAAKKAVVTNKKAETVAKAVRSEPIRPLIKPTLPPQPVTKAEQVTTRTVRGIQVTTVGPVPEATPKVKPAKPRPVKNAVQPAPHPLNKPKEIPKEPPKEVPVVKVGVTKTEPGETVPAIPEPKVKAPRYRAPKTTLSFMPEDKTVTKPFQVPHSKPKYEKEPPAKIVTEKITSSDLDRTKDKWVTNGYFYKIKAKEAVKFPRGATAKDVLDHETETLKHALRINTSVDLKKVNADWTVWVSFDKKLAAAGVSPDEAAYEIAKIPTRYSYFRVLAQDDQGRALIQFHKYPPRAEDMASLEMVPPAGVKVSAAPPMPEDIWPEGVLPPGVKPGEEVTTVMTEGGIRVSTVKPAAETPPAPKIPHKTISISSHNIVLPKGSKEDLFLREYLPNWMLTRRKGAKPLIKGRKKTLEEVSKFVDRKIMTFGEMEPEQLHLALNTLVVRHGEFPPDAGIIIGSPRGRGGSWSLRAGQTVQETVDELFPGGRAVLIDPATATPRNGGSVKATLMHSTDFKGPLFQDVGEHGHQPLMDVLNGPPTVFREAVMDLLDVHSRDEFVERLAGDFSPVIDEIADKMQGSNYTLLFKDFTPNEQEALRFLINNYVDPNYPGLYSLPHRPVEKYAGEIMTREGKLEKWVHVMDLGLDDIQSPYQFTDLFVNANSHFLGQINQGRFPRFSRTSAYMMEALERRGYDAQELLTNLDSSSLFNLLTSGRKQVTVNPPDTWAFRDFIDPSEVKHLVHHASPAEFTTFSISRDLGYHFGDLYTANRHLAWSEGTIIHDYWIRLTKSLELEDSGHWTPFNIRRQLLKKGMITKEEALALELDTKAVVDEVGRLFSQVRLDTGATMSREQVINIVDQLYHQFPILAKHGNFDAEDLITELDGGAIIYDIMKRFEDSRTIAELNARWGYDGIKYVNAFEGKGSTSYIVFYKTNIKRTDNIGTYDTSSSNVLWQMLNKRADGAEKRIGVSRLAIDQWTQIMNSMIDNYHTLFINPDTGFLNANVMVSYPDALTKSETVYLIGDGFDYVTRTMGETAKQRYLRGMAQALRRAGLDETDIFHMGDARFVIQIDDPAKLDDILRVIEEAPTVRVADEAGELWDIDLSVSYGTGPRNTIPKQFDEAQAMSEATRVENYKIWLLRNGDNKAEFPNNWSALDDADATGATIATYSNIRPAEEIFEEVDTDEAGTLFQRLGAADDEPLYAKTKVPDNTAEILEAWRAFVQSPILERGTERVSIQDLWGVLYGDPNKLYLAGPEGFANLTRRMAEELSASGFEDTAQMLESLSGLARNFEQYVEGSVIKLDTLVPPPLPFYQTNPQVRQWLSNLYGVGGEWANGKKLLLSWKDEFGQKVTTSPRAELDLTADMHKILDEISNEGAMLKRDLNDVVNYGGDVAGVHIPRAQGAVNETNFTMIDYTDFSKFDQIMKGIVPFWMYPSKSAPFWIRTLTQHPALVSFYNKYLRWSKMAALQAGAVNSRGEQLPSLKGYIPILPGLWFNPTAPFLFRYAFPRLDTIPEEEADLSPLQHIAKFFLEDAPVFGINASPVMSAVMQTLYDPYYPKTNLGYELTKAVIPIEFIPPFVERWLMDKTRTIAQGWSAVPERFQEEVSWKDYLIEREILIQALEQINATENEIEKERIAKEAYAVITRDESKDGPREEDPTWVAARSKIENTEYFRRMVGMFTGIYTKEFTSGYADLIALRNEVNVLRDSINDAVNTTLFFPYMSQTDVYDAYIDRRYETPDGWVWNAYAMTRYVTDDEGNELSGDLRRQRIAQEAIADNHTQLRYQAIQEAADRRDERLKSIPVGADDLRDKIWEDYYAEYDKIDDPNGLYPYAKKDYVLGYKPIGKMREYMEGKWWRTIKSSYPRKAKEETWTEFDLRVKAWEADLPNQARRLAPIFLTSLSWMVWDSGVAIEDRMSQVPSIIQELVKETSAEGYDGWRLKNDTVVDAIWGAYEALYLQPYFDATRDLTGNERRLAEIEFLSTHPTEPSETEVLQWIQERYGTGKFSQKDVIETIRGSNFATPDEIANLSDNPPDPNRDKVYDILAWAGPQQSEQYKALMLAYLELGGYESDFDVWWGTGGNIESYPDVEDYYEFVDRIQEAALKVGATAPNEQQLRDMLQAETDHAEFKSSVMAELGGTFYSTLAAYMYLSSDDRKEWRNANKDLYAKINRYFDMRDEFAANHPLWASYYYPSYAGGTGAGGTGTGGTGGGYAGGGYAGSTFEREESDWWIPMGLRASLDAMSLFGANKLGSGGVIRRPWWPQELLDLLDPEAVEQIASGNVTPATVTYLKKVAARYPEYASVIRRNLTKIRGYQRSFTKEHQEVME